MSNLIYFQGEMAHLFFFLKEALTKKCANFISIYNGKNIEIVKGY